MPKIRIRACQVVIYDQIVEVSHEQADEVLSTPDDRDGERELRDFADIHLDFSDVFDAYDVEDVEVELVED